jgi:hypothetical protein
MTTPASRRLYRSVVLRVDLAALALRRHARLRLKNLTEARTLGAALERDPEMSGGAIASREARPLGTREHRREVAL